jgi:hypothetical protein
MHDENNSLTPRTSPSNVRACTDQLERTLSTLQEQYGITSVIAALIDVAGCGISMNHAVRGSSLRALIERIERHRAIAPPQKSASSRR